MMTKNNLDIAKTTLIASVGAVFGWIIFSAIVEMFPFLIEAEPLFRIIIGITGIIILIRLGLRK